MSITNYWRNMNACLILLLITTTIPGVSSVDTFAASTATSTAYLPRITTPPPPQVAITSQLTDKRGDSVLYVAGEISNTTSKTAYDAQITMTGIAADGAVIARKVIDAALPRIDPGQRVPFSTTFNEAVLSDHIELSLTYLDHGLHDYRPITVVSSQRHPHLRLFDIDITGVARNDQQQPVGQIRVAITEYDVNGKFLTAGDIMVSATPLMPGDNVSFAASYYPLPPFSGSSFYTYTVQLQGVAE